MLEKTLRLEKFRLGDRIKFWAKSSVVEMWPEINIKKSLSGTILENNQNRGLRVVPKRMRS